MQIERVELTDRQAAFLRTCVADGRYLDAGEALRAGLELLEQKERVDALKLEHIRKLVQEGFDEIDRGECETITADTIDDFMASVIAEARAKARVGASA